jgi:hypothetical protein
MAGSLTQLVSIGDQNIRMHLRNVVYEYFTYNSTGINPLSILRNSDIVTPEYLELSFTNPDTNNLDHVKKVILTMSIGGKTIQQIPLSLLVNLNEPMTLDGKMYIKLCFEMLFGDLKLIGLQYHEVKFELTNANFITRYGIVTKLTYVDHDERRDLIENSVDELIQQISFIDVKTDLSNENETSDIYDLRYLPFTHISKGFFIECNNIDNLNSIVLKFNDNERFNLNRFLLQTKCKKITQTLLYLPFNYDKSFYERTIQSYEGGANLSRINAVHMTLKFDTAISSIKVYNLNSNIYKQMSGMGELAFCSNFCNGTYDLHNNKLRET